MSRETLKCVFEACVSEFYSAEVMHLEGALDVKLVEFVKEGVKLVVD